MNEVGEGHVVIDGEWFRVIDAACRRDVKRVVVDHRDRFSDH